MKASDAAPLIGKRVRYTLRGYSLAWKYGTVSKVTASTIILVGVTLQARSVRHMELAPDNDKET